MAIVINGSGTVTGLAVGGLPDGTVDAGTLATNSVDSAEIVDGAVDRSKLNTSIADSGNATAMTINATENVGIGVVPETWQSTRKVLQLGDSTAVWGDVYKNSWFSNNVYRNTSGTESYINASYAQTIYMNNGGTMDFKNSASGSADAAISWNTPLQITADGRGLSQFTAKAWVNFNGTGTVAIRDSHNVSSVTDNATGSYSINYSNNMANVNYSVVASSNGGGGDAYAGSWGDTDMTCPAIYSMTVSKYQQISYELGAGYFDTNLLMGIVFGD